LFVGSYKGVREVSHSGSTAGYNAFLARFPDQHVSVAVLCNVSSAQATQYAHAVSDLYLGDRLEPAPAATYTLTSADINRVAGVYSSDITGLPVTIAREKDGLRAGRSALLPQSAFRFLTAGRQVWELDAHGMRLTDEFGTVEEYGRMQPATPTVRELESYAGTYTSDEAEATMTAAVEHGALVLRRRPDVTIKLTPVYIDAFTAGELGSVIFRRDAAGHVNALSVMQDRVWDLRFVRTPR
jgi:hypothetical protein